MVTRRRAFAFTPTSILVIAAVVFFVLAAIGVDSDDVDLGALGLACFAASFLL
jgi:hypothetical protein